MDKRNKRHQREHQREIENKQSKESLLEFRNITFNFRIFIIGE